MSIRWFVIALSFLLNFYAFAQDFDLQGHRGARGLMPENTIPAFLMALDSGATTLEIDVVITKDGQVVVSHEPYISAKICLDSVGKPIPEDNERELNIYRMTYREVRQYDCGTKRNPSFPEQSKMQVRKPLLTDVFRNVERYIKDYTQYEVNYNIELKSSPGGDNLYHPPPDKFSDIVFNTINAFIPLERIIVQSFDFRILKYWNENYGEIKLAALVNNAKSIDTNLANLGFKPDIYSPNFHLLSRSKVRDLHNRGIKVIPWTVNDQKTMKKLIGWGVDGIITDYPNVLRCVLEEMDQP